MAVARGTSKFGQCYRFDAFLSSYNDYSSTLGAKRIGSFKGGTRRQRRVTQSLPRRTTRWVQWGNWVRDMRKTLALGKLVASAGLALALQIGASAAGDLDCYGNCYEEVPAPAVRKTFLRRVEIERGAYEIDRDPSLYGLATRRVMLDDGVDWQERPAVYKTFKVRKHVRGHIIWEKRWVDGKHIMCKVRVPGKTVWTTKRVLVSAGHRYKHRSQPTYGYVHKRILLRPYKNIAVYQRARHRYAREHVVILPEATIWQPVSGGPAYRY